mgnify:CR=1 FL=1
MLHTTADCWQCSVLLVYLVHKSSDVHRNPAKSAYFPVLDHCKDIFYKEGILEILENEINIDYIIINSQLEGEIKCGIVISFKYRASIA